MSEFFQAAEDIEKLAKLFKSMKTASEALRVVGSLDQTVKDKEKRIKNLGEDIAALKNTCEATQREADELAKETERKRAELMVELKEKRKEAEKLYTEAVKLAEKESKGLIESAQQEVTNMRAKAQADVDAAALEVSDVQKARDETLAACEAAQERLAGINLRISEARDAAKAIMGVE